jgi:putative PIN family toxin of toxin-antitoxin system
MRVVLDTNILVSGLLRSQGNPAQILALALSGAVQVCYNREILSEYSEVLARPRFKFDPFRVREVLTKIELDGVAIDATGQAALSLPDKDDEIFLAVALAATADFLVTGNLADYPPNLRRGCSAVSPAEFMDHWRSLKHGKFRV